MSQISIVWNNCILKSETCKNFTKEIKENNCSGGFDTKSIWEAWKKIQECIVASEFWP